MKIINNIAKGFHKSLEVAAHTVTHSEPLEKVAKIVDRVISALAVVFGTLSASMLDFGSRLKSSIIVFESLRFVGVMNMLVNPNPKTGKYLLTDPTTSWQKCVDRVTLAFHTAFKTVKGLNKFGFIGLGIMAKNAIGKLPIFTLAMDSFIIASSFFSTWDNIANGLSKPSEKIAKANKMLDKWEFRPTAIAFLKAEDEITRKYFETAYNEKASALKTKLAGLEKEARLNEDILQKTLELQKQEKSSQLPKIAQEKIIVECMEKSKALSLKIEGKQRKLLKTEERIYKIASSNYKGLAEDLEKSSAKYLVKKTDGKIEDLKMKKWEVYKANKTQERSKIWLRIANAVGKIAVVVFALTLTAINLWTAPFLLSLLGMGIIVDSIGLSKILIEEFWKPKPLPKVTSSVSL